MKSEDLKKKIISYTMSGKTPKIYLVEKKEKTKKGVKSILYTSYKFNIDDDLNSEIATEYVENVIKNIHNKSILDYDVTTSKEEVVESLKSSEVKEYLNINEVLNAKKSINFTTWASQQDFSMNRTFLVAIVFLSEENERMVLFRKFSGNKKLAKGKNITIVGEKLEEIENQVIHLDTKVDALLVEGNFYIVNRFYFNIIFAFKDMYENYIKDKKDFIKTTNIIDEDTKFVDACLKNGHYVRKLCKILIKDGFKEIKDNIENVKDIITDWDLKIEFDEKSKMIKYTDKKDIPEILDLFLNHYVKGALDGEKYVAEALQQYKKSGD